MGAENVLSTQNQSITNYDYSKLFRTNFKAVEMTYTNSSGGDVDLVPGMLFGRVSADLKGAILKSASTDGSETPYGVNLTMATVLDTASKTIQVAVTGMVDAALLVLDGSDTLDTLIDGRTIGDRIPADTEGITLENFKDLVNLDNQ
jgi:hypothetical protein